LIWFADARINGAAIVLKNTCVFPMFRFRWKWRKRCPIKIMERTHEEATEALSAGREVAILRRYLLDKEAISTLCDELGLQPTVIYRWQKEFFENGAAAFQPKAGPSHVALKKVLGEL